MSEPGGMILKRSSRPASKPPSVPSAPDPSARPSGSGPLVEANPETSPLVRQVRDLLAQGEYATAVRTAYRAAFDGTVRSYGLTVPPSCTDRQFLPQFLRADMGKLTEWLPELYRLYEPVRFGKIADGDRVAFEALVLKLYSETVLGRIHDPLFQPSGTNTRDAEPSEYPWRYDRLRTKEPP